LKSRSPEAKWNAHRQEKTGGERSGDPGDRVLKYFHREKGNLHEVMKSGVNLDHWIQKGHVEEIHIFQRSGALEERGE
jgi:hypothetical protein